MTRVVCNTCSNVNRQSNICTFCGANPTASVFDSERFGVVEAARRIIHSAPAPVTRIGPFGVIAAHEYDGPGAA